VISGEEGPMREDFAATPDEETHLGRWLVRHLSGLGEIELPLRHEGRPSPFEGWTEEDFADEATIVGRLAAFGAPRRESAEPKDLSIAPARLALVVNGEATEIAAANLAGALAALGYETAVVATALNGDFVPARKREATPVNAGDRIEIVAPRQGG